MTAMNANAANAMNAMNANAANANAMNANAAAPPAPRPAAPAAAPRRMPAAHSPLSRRPHRLLLCPECGGRLCKDKHPIIAETGTALRKRLCSRCGCAVHSRQLAEEITIVEPAE